MYSVRGHNVTYTRSCNLCEIGFASRRYAVRCISTFGYCRLNKIRWSYIQRRCSARRQNNLHFTSAVRRRYFDISSDVYTRQRRTAFLPRRVAFVAAFFRRYLDGDTRATVDIAFVSSPANARKPLVRFSHRRRAISACLYRSRVRTPDIPAAIKSRIYVRVGFFSSLRMRVPARRTPSVSAA